MQLIDDLDRLHKSNSNEFAMLAVETWPLISRVLRAELAEQETEELELKYHDDAERQELFGMALKKHYSAMLEEIVNRSKESVAAWVEMADWSETDETL